MQTPGCQILSRSDQARASQTKPDGVPDVGIKGGIRPDDEAERMRGGGADELKAGCRGKKQTIDAKRACKE